MRKLGITRRRSRVGTISHLVVGCAVSLIVAILPGCSSLGLGEKKKAAADPILGEVHPQSPAPYGPTPPADKEKSKNSTDNKTSANTPDDPFLGPSPTSNAYLASTIKPLPGGKPLAIADGQSGAFQLTGNSEAIIRPVPKDPAFVNNSWIASPTNANPNSAGQFVTQPGNFVDPQIALLQARGITQHRVIPMPDGSVRLMAVAPQPDNATQLRNYDVTARDVPAAVQAVLQQMDRQR